MKTRNYAKKCKIKIAPTQTICNMKYILHMEIIVYDYPKKDALKFGPHGHAIFYSYKQLKYVNII